MSYYKTNPYYIYGIVEEGSYWLKKKKIAGSPNTPNDMLKKLLRGGDIKMEVAKNPNLSKIELEKISEVESTLVKLGLILNPNLTFKIAKKLATDSDSVVRLHLRKNLCILKFSMEKKSELEEAIEKTDELYKYFG